MNIKNIKYTPTFFYSNGVWLAPVVEPDAIIIYTNANLIWAMANTGDIASSVMGGYVVKSKLLTDAWRTDEPMPDIIWS